MDSAERRSVHLQVAAQACIAVCDEAMEGAPYRDIADGMCLAAASTVAGNQMFLAAPERGLLLSRLTRRLAETIDEELKRPAGANLIGVKKDADAKP